MPERSNLSSSNPSWCPAPFRPSLLTTHVIMPLQDARGDQCDACGNLLNPTELINPKCKFSGTKPIIR